jgi:hypothetical protein
MIEYITKRMISLDTMNEITKSVRRLEEVLARQEYRQDMADISRHRSILNSAIRKYARGKECLSCNDPSLIRIAANLQKARTRLFEAERSFIAKEKDETSKMITLLRESYILSELLRKTSMFYIAFDASGTAVSLNVTLGGILWLFLVYIFKGEAASRFILSRDYSLATIDNILGGTWRELTKNIATI